MPSLVLTSHSIAQLQALVNNIGVANRQMVQVNAILYYVTKQQIPFNTANSFLSVYKSDATGLTWSLGASSSTGPNSPGSGSATEFSIVAVGTKIYIAEYGTTQAGIGSGNFKLVIWTYDTVANTLSGPGPDGPFAHDTIAVGLTVLNSGTLVLAYSVAADAYGNTNQFLATTYNPATTTWGSSFTLDAAGTSQTVAQIHDTSTDKTVVFYNKGGTNSLLAAVLSNTPAVLTNTAALFTFGGGFQFIEVWGLPVVTTDSNSGGVSAALPFVTGGPPIARIIFVDLGTFATATETVDDTTDLPVGSQIQVYDQQDQPGSAALVFNGTLYVIFAVDNGDLDSAASQSFLYAKNRTGGVWGGLQILLTSALSREMLTAFPASWNANGPAIMVQLWDPTKNIVTAPDATGLTSFILLPAAVNPTKFEISLFGTKRFGKSPEPECVEAPEPKHVKLFG